MNSSQLLFDCKKEARKIYDRFLYLNKIEEMDEITLEGFIDMDIKQTFRAKVFKNHVNANISKNQLEFLDKEVSEFESILISACIKYHKKTTSL